MLSSYRAENLLSEEVWCGSCQLLWWTHLAPYVAVEICPVQHSTQPSHHLFSVNTRQTRIHFIKLISQLLHHTLVVAVMVVMEKYGLKVKIKRCTSPFLRPPAVESLGGWTTWVCDTWPLQRQTYSYRTVPVIEHHCPVSGTKLYTAWWRRHVCKCIFLAHCY